MAFEVWTDPGFQRELAELAADDQQAILASLRGFAVHPTEHPRQVRLKGSAYPGSFRLRLGRHRVLGLVLAAPRLILLTTVFLKKRESDYDQALDRHERRLRAQGPPLGDYVRMARRKR